MTYFRITLLKSEAAIRGFLQEKVLRKLAQAFSCEFSEISKNTFPTEHHLGSIYLSSPVSFIYQYIGLGVRA